MFFGAEMPVHERNIIRVLTASRPTFTAMADQQSGGALDWDLYRHLKAEGRLNLLFRLSGALAARLPRVDTPVERPNVLPFISRADHLAWRERWKSGRWTKLSWTPDERDAILRQDEASRRADAEWTRRHGHVRGGAVILHFPS